MLIRQWIKSIIKLFKQLHANVIKSTVLGSKNLYWINLKALQINKIDGNKSAF